MAGWSHCSTHLPTLDIVKCYNYSWEAFLWRRPHDLFGSQGFFGVTTQPDKQFQVSPQNTSTRSLNLLFQEAFHNSSKSEQGSLVLFFWGSPVLCSWCSWTSWNREWPILALDSTPEPRTRGYWMNFYWMNKRINVISSSPSVWCMVRGSCTLLKEWMNGQNSQVQ